MESPCGNIEIESVKPGEISRPIIMVDMSARRDEISIVCGKCLDSAGVEVSELEAGWRIVVGKELQRKRRSRTEGTLIRLKFDRWPAKSDD